MPKQEIGADFIFGGEDEPQPDWRKGDTDDKINDNDDPSPISPKILIEMLGFYPDDEDEDDE